VKNFVFPSVQKGGGEARKRLAELCPTAKKGSFYTQIPRRWKREGEKKEERGGECRSPPDSSRSSKRGGAQVITLTFPSYLGGRKKRGGKKEKKRDPIFDDFFL